MPREDEFGVHESFASKKSRGDIHQTEVEESAEESAPSRRTLQVAPMFGRVCASNGCFVAKGP